MSTLISPPVILERHSLFIAKASKFKPTDPPQFFARFLISRSAENTEAWRHLLLAIEDEGQSNFGSGYTTMMKNGTFRLPIHREVAGKGWPSDIAAYINVKSGENFKPIVVDRDALPIMDQAELYPGCKIRASLRVYAYGGAGMPYPPGVGLGLNNVQKLADGPRLSAARGDGSEFGAISDDLDDLLK